MRKISLYQVTVWPQPRASNNKPWFYHVSERVPLQTSAAALTKRLILGVLARTEWTWKTKVKSKLYSLHWAMFFGIFLSFNIQDGNPCEHFRLVYLILRGPAQKF